MSVHMPPKRSYGCNGIASHFRRQDDVPFAVEYNPHENVEIVANEVANNAQLRRSIVGRSATCLDLVPDIFRVNGVISFN